MVSCGHASMQMVNLTSDSDPRGRAGPGSCGFVWGEGYLKSFGPVDGSKGPKYSEYSQNLHYRDGTRAGEGAVHRS